MMDDMKDDTLPRAVTRGPVGRSLLRAAPTALGIVPVAMLCGVLAAQSGWDGVDVFLFSAFGFSGSGQLALLPLAGQGLGVLTMLLMALSINSRYIPIAFATANRLPSARLPRILTAHMLGDEAYAVEQERDCSVAVVTIRLSIYVVWVLSNMLGAWMFSSIPEELINAHFNLAFPASAVLLVLSLRQLQARIAGSVAPWTRRTCEIAMCVLVAIFLCLLLGKVWFWLPSIAFTTWRMREVCA
ncbi:hypothetical protein RB25_03300 [Herbaspirillum rubrisubalbicans]|uniref:Branched-chain amino acid ABC transporter permease n=2 Tax=Herbaspirillum rubrisubalbicans TaxID=80842 RepID=A0ABX9C2U4_9BURK|nr:hypothetical protein RB24_10720 [Herbaspirillum rubrisubalbicans]RAN49891.1 hypothetical protein RB25_03300 [Herbaspirillum rubrisubalbicans]